MRHTGLSATAMAVAATLCGCSKPPAVRPYGSIASAGHTSPLSPGEVAPVDDFLKRHEPVLGILATPAVTDPTRVPLARQPGAPATPARDNRRPDLTIR